MFLPLDTSSMEKDPTNGFAALTKLGSPGCKLFVYGMRASSTISAAGVNISRLALFIMNTFTSGLKYTSRFAEWL